MKNSLSSKNSLNPVPSSPTTGKHILAEFWQCQCDPQLLTSTQPLLSLLTQAVEQAGLTLVGHAVHEFEQYEAQNDNESDSNLKQLNQDTAPAQTSGVTLTLLLAESHLCLHTW